MSHESYAPRFSGNLMAARITDGVVGRYVGPMAATVVEQEAQSDVTRVKDTRRGRRGLTLRAFADPKEPVGALELTTVPGRMLAALFLGTASVYAVEAATVSAQVVEFEEDYWTDLAPHIIASSFAVTVGVRASLATGVVNDNNGLTWTAVDPGTGGNAIAVVIANPGTNNAALAVSVSGSTITVSAATNGSAAITSTAAAVLAAVNADAEAAALVTVAHTGASTGAAAVTAVSSTPLANGAAGATVAAEKIELNPRLGQWRPVLGNGTLAGSGKCLVSYQTTAKTGGLQVQLGTSTTVRMRLKLDAVDDGPGGGDMQWVAWSALVTPDGPMNFMSAEAVTGKFKLEFETPEGHDEPTLLIWPDREPT